MERIGKTKTEKLSENEFLYEWYFSAVVFNKSYRSDWCSIFPNKNVNACQMAIVPDNSKCAVRFFLFLYGNKELSGPKMSFSASFVDKEIPACIVSWPEACLDLETSMKLFEIHSSHPILFNCKEYVFKLKIKLLPEDLTITPSFSNINICSETSQVEGRAPSNTIEEIPKNAQYLKELSQDMKSLYSSGDMCDLEIRIGEDILRVHKLILCARSPVFKKMMEHECLESLSNSITIDDYATPPFVEFLKYLYTGEIEGSTTDTVMSLFSLGDKYDVPVLKEACSNILQSKLSSESVDDIADIVCNVLQLAECHKDSKLKDLAASFIVNHFPVVSNKQSWKDLMKNNSELISNILVLVASGLHKQVYKTVHT